MIGAYDLGRQRRVSRLRPPSLSRMRRNFLSLPEDLPNAAECALDAAGWVQRQPLNLYSPSLILRGLNAHCLRTTFAN